MPRLAIAAFAATAVTLAAGCGSGSSAPARTSTSSAPASKPPAFRPADFVAHVTNPWFPLPAGRTLHYRGEEDGTPGRDVFTVTHRRKTILGVHATVVHDRVAKHGRVVEDSFDYYAQDRRGYVWYVGEDTKELDRHGKVTSREGTWRAGRQGAKAGVFMPPRPRVGQSFQQEVFPGHAEDHFRVVRRTATVQVPYVTTHHALRTLEWTPLEPGVRDAKLYVRGVGTAFEETIRGGDEQWRLVRITH